MTAPSDPGTMQGPIIVTGANGFLGWHLRVYLYAHHRHLDVYGTDRNDFADTTRLASKLSDAQTIMHLAGVNRADTDSRVEQENLHIAQGLSQAIRDVGRPVHLVYANSIQAGRDTPYGRGKTAAGAELRQAVSSVGGTMTDVLLPNLFGEHGRPHYNSFVATFCHELVAGHEPTVHEDALVPLLHSLEACEILVRAARTRHDQQVRPDGQPRKVSQIRDLLKHFHTLYSQAQIPDVSDEFDLALFNTYRSFTFPQAFPSFSPVNTDRRGTLFEILRSHGGGGQSFVSNTRPGMTRGNHFHLRKIERFAVVAGHAEIALRRVHHDNVVTFRVSGDEPAVIDMPTMWAHNITNVGDQDLVTIFWADQLLDAAAPDTYPEPVQTAEGASA